MKIQGDDYRIVWFEEGTVHLIDQPKLPFKFEIFKSENYRKTADAISTMVVRGAPAIGATAGYATAQAVLEFDGDSLDDFSSYLDEAGSYIKKARPTAIDLMHAVDRVSRSVKNCDSVRKCKETAVEEAEKIADEYVDMCKAIGKNGNELIKEGDGILTHCNAGALATVDYGTALAPMRAANKSGKDIFVFVDETRPRLQGARLTAFELAQEKINHAVIADNAAGHYMQTGDIDLGIVGADRIAANGDVANKIGTYEKAVIAKENGIPFYVAAPVPTFDFECPSGKEIPIEERNESEVKKAFSKEGDVQIANESSSAKNPAFDVTPAKYITAYITDKGVIKSSEIPKLKE
ncbi:MAG: S-methyl-5-thioribose-1-phosphate isomerase [Candidatus Undinarchaeales archaeon]